MDGSLDAKAGKIIIIMLIIIMISDNHRNSKSTYKIRSVAQSCPTLATPYRKHLLLALIGKANTWRSNNP